MLRLVFTVLASSSLTIIPCGGPIRRTKIKEVAIREVRLPLAKFKSPPRKSTKISLSFDCFFLRTSSEQGAPRGMNQPPSASPDDLLPATPLRHHVYEALRIYFHNLGDQQPSNLYDLVLREMESPLLEIVMLRTQGNQSQAATLLGINRGTLRKKLRQHGIDATNESTYTSIITEQAHESGNFRP